MSYGVALRNGVPFTLGTIAALCVNATTQWNPLSLWPDGIATPGMWISPRDLTSQWADYTGTTPVSVPGTVADSANPVGLALDIRAGAPEVLGPEDILNGDFSADVDWTLTANAAISGGKLNINAASGVYENVATQTTGGRVTIGKYYKVTFDVVWVSGGVSFFIGELDLEDKVGRINLVASGSYSFVQKCRNADNFFFRSEGGFTGSVDNISVREVPGNHMLQSTSAARPLLSARVNALKYTQDLTNGYWAKFATTTYGTNYIQETAATQPYGFGPTGAPLSGVDAITLKAKIKAGVRSKIYFGVVGSGNIPGSQFVVDIAAKSATITNQGASVGAFSYVEEGDWLRVSCSTTGMAGSTTSIQIIAVASNLSYPFSYTGTDGEIALYVTELSLTPTEQADLPYQAILTDGSSYSSTGFPIAQIYDGVDDGMATAAFAAGTLIDGMDCMIAVRRDSAATVVLGLYAAGTGTYFGVSDTAGSNSANAGAPTVWVDGVQLSGGTNVLAATINSAVTVGAWHILEFRGLDLSAWTQMQFGGYPYGYALNGTRGDILLYPSTASTTDKDAARQWLADYYGVTLP